MSGKIQKDSNGDLITQESWIITPQEFLGHIGDDFNMGKNLPEAITDANNKLNTYGNNIINYAQQSKQVPVIKPTASKPTPQKSLLSNYDKTTQDKIKLWMQKNNITDENKAIGYLKSKKYIQ